MPAFALCLSCEHIKDVVGAPAELTSRTARYLRQHTEVGELPKGVERGWSADLQSLFRCPCIEHGLLKREVDELVGRASGRRLHADPVALTEVRETLAEVPHLAARVTAGQRVERFRWAPVGHGFFRQAGGPGWALVGDAGYHKDPITAQGMADAFRDADLLADAVDRGLEGDLDAELAGYQEARDAAALPMYEFTCGLADIVAPPTPEMLGLVAALDGNHAQISRFLGLIAGSTPIPEFFSPESIGQIMADAQAPAA